MTKVRHGHDQRHSDRRCGQRTCWRSGHWCWPPWHPSQASLVSGLYRDSPGAIRQAQRDGPCHLAAWRAGTGAGPVASPGRLGWGRAVAVGALGYLAYSYAIYAFSVVINAMTPIHIAILGLAAWGLVLVPHSPRMGVLRTHRPPTAAPVDRVLPGHGGCDVRPAVAGPDRGRHHERRPAAVRQRPRPADESGVRARPGIRGPVVAAGGRLAHAF